MSEGQGTGTASREVKVGKTYKISPMYSSTRTIVIRVLEILHTWETEGTEYVAVWAYRVRPNDLSVSFGNAKGYVFRLSQATELEV